MRGKTIRKETGSEADAMVASACSGIALCTNEQGFCKHFHLWGQLQALRLVVYILEDSGSNCYSLAKFLRGFGHSYKHRSHFSSIPPDNICLEAPLPKPTLRCLSGILSQ